MEAVTLILLLLLAVTISGIAIRMLPAAIPMPFVQIALGIAIGSFAGSARSRVR